MSSLGYRFWIIFYLKWILYISSLSLLIGISISFLISAFLYFSSETKNIDAIFTVFLFNLKIWTLLGLSISFILSFKKMFHISIENKRFTLAKHCNIQAEIVQDVTVSDIRKIWRVWLLKTVFHILILNISVRVIQGFLEIETSMINFYILIFSIFIIGGLNMIYTFAFNRDINICISK